MLKLKDRIGILKNSTTNEEVVRISNLAINACNSSEALNTIIAESLINDLTPYNDDAATNKFVLREKRLNAINNLGVKDLIKKISESELMLTQSIKYNLNSFMNYVDTNPEYFLARPFMEQFKGIAWHKDVKDGFNAIEENLKIYEDDINLCSFIHEFELSSGDYLKKSFINEFDAYFIERDEYTKKRLIEKITPYLHDPMLKGLNEFLNSSNAKFQSTSNNVADVKPIYSPVIIKENEEIFYASGKFFRKNGNQLSVIDETEVNKLSKSFLMLSQFINNQHIKINENEITIYTSNKKVKILKESNELAIYLNDKKLSFASFTKFFMNEGVFRTSDNDVLANTVNLYENFDNIYEIDYAKRIVSKINEYQWVDLYKLGKNIYVSKVDAFNKTNEFYTNLNATQTRNLVLEYLNYDISKSFRDLLPSEELKLKEYTNEIGEIDESIEYLTNKKTTIINEANNSALLRNNNQILDIISAIDDEVTSLKEKKLVLKNSISQFETIGIGFSPDEYTTEQSEVDKFWNEPENRKKTIYFAQLDKDNTYLIGSQTYENYKDAQSWIIEDNGFSEEAATVKAKELSEQTSNGFFFQTKVNEGIKVKNVGKAIRILKSNGIKVTSAKYSDGIAGEISTESYRQAKSLLRGYGIANEANEDADGINKLEKKEKNTKEHPSNENELQTGDKIKMKNGNYGIVNTVNNSTGEVIINMEDGKSVSVPKQYVNELEIITKKAKENNPEVKISDGSQTVQIVENNEWIKGTLKINGKLIPINIFALDYTSKGSKDLIRVKDENGDEDEIKKELISIN